MPPKKRPSAPAEQASRQPPRHAAAGHAHDDHGHDHDHDHAHCEHCDHHRARTLTLYSPAGVVAKAAPVRKAVKRLGKLGFQVQLDETALLRHQRFAGDDDTRLAALHRVAQAAPDVALATRGGYGLTRLLDRIDWPLIAQSVERGTAWVGYSDVTALQLAALAHKAAGPAKVGHGVTAGF